MTVATADTNEPEVRTDLRFLWLEITGRCQLGCEHCYADSGPTGTHGSMTVDDWRRVIDEAATLGVEMVQFIGDEPTLHPDLPILVRHALDRGIEVEVFSNLVRVSAELWQTFELPGVRLATSYYSADPAEHESITGRRGSHARTLDGITEALRRDIPLRVGVIGLRDGQDVDDACRQLVHWGVTDVGVDHLRQVGRGVRDRESAMDQLCGNCADGVLAILPDGIVRPCVFSRWMSAGDLHRSTLADVIGGSSPRAAREALVRSFEERIDPSGACKPDPTCNPKCMPRTCQPRCGPNRISSRW